MCFYSCSDNENTNNYSSLIIGEWLLKSEKEYKIENDAQIVLSEKEVLNPQKWVFDKDTMHAYVMENEIWVHFFKPQLDALKDIEPSISLLNPDSIYQIVYKIEDNYLDLLVGNINKGRGIHYYYKITELSKNDLYIRGDKDYYFDDNGKRVYIDMHFIRIK